MADFTKLATFIAAGVASLASGRNCFLPNTQGAPDWASWFPSARAGGGATYAVSLESLSSGVLMLCAAGATTGEAFVIQAFSTIK